MIDCSDFQSFGQYFSTHGFTDTVTCFVQNPPFNTANIGNSLWMIIALPILGAFFCGVFGKFMGRSNTHLIASASVFGSFLLSVMVFWAVNPSSTVAPNPFGSTLRYAVGADYGTWFQAGDFRVNFGLLADHLSASMLMVITGVGFLIHLYSTSYMSHDKAYWRYFAYLNLFVAMMLTLVLADSLVLLFVGWEGVGMCSYLLIGFWYDDPAKAFAGRKAFITNRIGDFGFLVACFLLVLTMGAFTLQAKNNNFPGDGTGSSQVFKAGLSAKGPLSFAAIDAFTRALPSKADSNQVTLSTVIDNGPLKGFAYGAMVTVILLCFLLGAAGKSAQFPLYVWLPDAMAGPTPVSALIHAATMVTAGIYLFCRLSYLVVLSPTAMAVIAVTGGITALLAALIAFAQDDIKKILAYSTVSQLGFMFMAIGAGAFWAAFLHVVTHAFFKACLFLGAGSVMHGNAEETNIKKLGGLSKEMPVTWATFLISTLAITGMVPLSGFFSKDAILHALHTTTLEGYEHILHWVWYVGLATAACTAFYMMRLYVLTFHGTRAPDAKVPHAHESDWQMTLPLVVLAMLAIAAVAHGIPVMENANREGPLQTVMENYLHPVFQNAMRSIEATGFVTVEHEEGLPWGAWGMAWAIALAGGGLSIVLYRFVFKRDGQWSGPAEFIRSLAQHKFYVDELYELLVIRPVKFVSFIFFKIVDSLLIDTVAVRGTAWVTAQTGAALRYLQSGDAQSYAAIMTLGLMCALFYALFKVL
ncbi:MAG: NADH-quinone oxidoreductase subunit L [Myxococcaceae bacterium]|nr:NADH-quinone oxidoreductase subunit L [Myxococcaceae bacterium]